MDEITQAVLAMYARRRAPLPVVVRDELDELFADGEFARAFADRGTPGWSPGCLAMITVLQMVENLTDRQAAEAVRDKISWKHVLGLALTDPGSTSRCSRSFVAASLSTAWQKGPGPAAGGAGR